MPKRSLREHPRHLPCEFCGWARPKVHFGLAHRPPRDDGKPGPWYTRRCQGVYEWGDEGVWWDAYRECACGRLVSCEHAHKMERTAAACAAKLNRRNEMEL